MFSPLEWIACGGILLPVGHWVFQKPIQKIVESTVKETKDSFCLYELYDSPPITPLSFGKQFQATNLQPFRIAVSEETMPTERKTFQNYHE